MEYNTIPEIANENDILLNKEKQVNNDLMGCMYVLIIIIIFLSYKYYMC
jgi:hypothetical protein